MPCDYPAGAAFNAEPPNFYPALFGVTMVGGGVLSQYRYASVFKQDDAAFVFFSSGVRAVLALCGGPRENIADNVR